MTGLSIVVLFVTYVFTDHPDKIALLFAAVIVAISGAIDRMSNTDPYRSRS